LNQNFDLIRLRRFLLEERGVQVWIIAKSRKRNPFC